jgi:hypothetical protein
MEVGQGPNWGCSAKGKKIGFCGWVVGTLRGATNRIQRTDTLHVRLHVNYPAITFKPPAFFTLMVFLKIIMHNT